MRKTQFEAIQQFIEWVHSDEGYGVLQAALVGNASNAEAIEDAFERDIDTINAYGPLEKYSREQVCFYARLARKKRLNAPIPSEEALASLMSMRPYENLQQPEPGTDS